MRSPAVPPVLLSCSLGILLAISPKVSTAQSSSDFQTASPQEPLTVLEQDDPNSPNNVFTERSTNTSLLNLLNRIQLLNGRSPGEFAAEQDESFNNAVDEFHKKQQQQIDGQDSSAPAPSNPSEQ